MRPIDKKIKEDIKEGNIPEPIEDLPGDYARERIARSEAASPISGETERRSVRALIIDDQFYTIRAANPGFPHLETRKRNVC